MFETQVIQMAYRGLMMILTLSGPPVLIGMFFGLMVAIFQTATQIQEQTLSITVKLVAVTFTLILLGGFLGGQIMSFARELFTNFPKWVH